MPLTTATTTTITAPMSLSSSPTTTSNPSPDAAMQPFTPGHCLLCPNSFPSFDDSVLHMQKSHGLFVPHRQHLAVDLETLFRYLHLIIFGYRECIQCKTTKTTVQAIQQHMTGKGHCKFDISEPDSEFAEFYDFSEPEDDSESDIEERIQDETATTSSRQKPLLADKESIHLPSGRIILRKSSAQAEPSFLTRLHRQRRASASRIEYSVPESDDDEDEASKEGLDSDIDNTRALSRREKREKAMVKFQLTNMSANDRSSLMHLSAPQQRSILATQHKQEKKAQKEESRRRSHIDRKGNKNLYAYWATETPVYLCG